MTGADNHGITFDYDDAGWVIAICDCGWESGPQPGHTEAADAYGDHRAGHAAAKVLWRGPVEGLFPRDDGSQVVVALGEPAGTQVMVVVE